MTEDTTPEDLADAFNTILNAEKQELADYYAKLHEENFSDSSAVHCESDMRAWIQQQFIKDVLGHLHGVPPKLCIELDNPSGVEFDG